MVIRAKTFAAVIFLVASLLVCRHSAVAAEPSWPPKFEQFPAASTYKGNLQLDTSHGCGKKFRDQLKFALKGGVNFAGHCVHAEWGCGSFCQSHGIIDVETGKVNCDLPTTQVGISCRKNSRLIICNPQDKLGQLDADMRKATSTSYFVWENGKLRELQRSGAGHH